MIDDWEDASMRSMKMTSARLFSLNENEGMSNTLLYYHG